MFGLSNVYHYVRGGFRPSGARLARWWSTAHTIIARQKLLTALSDDDLRGKAREYRFRLKAGEPVENALVEVFAVVREAARRTLGYEHYPVQLMGAMAIIEGGIAEMMTGEGKTLTAAPAAALRGLLGQGAHVITVNDYLAKRDAHEMEPIYNMLGLSVGCVQEQMEDGVRRKNYAKDITYGTAKEFGFDFLRDRLKSGTDAVGEKKRTGLFGEGGGEAETVQRGHYFALIDEADSILVDEARTPLIIALNQPNDPATVTLYRWSNRVSQELKPNTDFVYEPDKRFAYLTDEGCRRVMLISKPLLLDTVDMPRMYKQVEQALIARYGFILDKDYVVHEDKITIVDEGTGRMMDGRKWQDGLHQAVEAKEHVTITAATGQAARVTVQSFFQNYLHVGGMTGTAWQVRGELWRTFRTRVTVIPTHRRCIRKGLATRVFRTQLDKMHAIVAEIERLRAAGRSILVGTPSVGRSEMLGGLLREKGIEHNILNALYHEQEAEIVSMAGQPGRVTIATNMAGRGTDIKLDPSVKAAGGLHVIATEMHSSKRIDRQLIGRAARQGDPGGFQFFLSLEDELLRCLDQQKVARMRARARANSNGELSRSWLGFFQRTQQFLERQHYKQRKTLLKAEKTRNEQYKKMGLDPCLEMTE